MFYLGGTCQTIAWLSSWNGEEVSVVILPKVAVEDGLMTSNQGNLLSQTKWSRADDCYDDCMSSGTVYPFCERLKNRTPLKLECTVDQLAVAICNLVQYPATLDANYQVLLILFLVSQTL